MVIIDVGARYRFDSRIFTTGFPGGCDCGKCSSLCCEAGVLIDTKERKTIESVEKEVLPLLAENRRNPEKWFTEPDDKDFERGSEGPVAEADKEGICATGTGEGYCNFYNPLFGCALQELARRQGRHKWAYKPSACILYPLFEEDEIIKPDSTLDSNLWCADKANHVTTVFRACLEELEYVAGRDAVEKLKALEKDYRAGDGLVSVDGRLRTI